MKDYRRILEVTADATEEQIKAQYKRLVRIYHPDRFTNLDDKLYVEQKLQEINEAYRALLQPAFNTFTASNGTPMPQPIALPATLNFGELSWGKQQTLVFHVDNSGGTVQSLQLEYSEVDGWFKVTKGRRLHAHQPFPMEFAVVVDTARLEVGKSYQGWIQVKMDNVATQVALAVKVVAKQPLSLLSPRLALITSMIALLLIVGFMQVFDHPLLIAWYTQATLPAERDPVASALVLAGSEQSGDSIATPGGLPELAVPHVTPTVMPTTAATVVIQLRSALSSTQASITAAATPFSTTASSSVTAVITVTASSGDRGEVTGIPVAVAATADVTSLETRIPATLTPRPSPTARPTMSMLTPITAPPATANTGGTVTRLVTVPANYYVNGRADILVESTVLQILPSGSQWVAIGRTPDASWLLLQVDKQQLAWVSTTTVIITDDVAALPIVDPGASNKP